MKISLIFAIVGLLISLCLGAIVIAFGVVTNYAVNQAVINALQGELDVVQGTISGIVREVVVPAKALSALLLDLNQTALYLPRNVLDLNESQEQLRPFVLGMSMKIQHLLADPALSYVYQTYEAPDQPGRWSDYGIVRTRSSPLVEVPNLTPNASVFDGSYSATVPMSLIPVSSAARDTTEASWRYETEQNTPEDFVSGRWMSTSSFADDLTGLTKLLATYSRPLHFNAANRCTCALNIDVAMDSMESTLRKLATKTNRLFVVDPRQTYQYTGAVIASSVEGMVQFDPNTSLPWPWLRTPWADVNRLLARVESEFGGLTAAAASRTNFLIENFEETIIAVAHVYGEGGLHFIIVSQIPREFYFASTSRTVWGSVGGGIAALVVSVITFFLVYVSLVNPLNTMLVAMRSISTLDDSNLEHEPFLNELRPLHDELLGLNTAVQSFARYVPKDIVKELLMSKNLCSIAMVDTEAQMLFVDIADFTGLCERISTEQLSELVLVYFEHMTSVVLDHSGVVDKFIGDAIMAVFNAPLSTSNSESLCALTALRIHHMSNSEPLTSRFEAIDEHLEVRVGCCGGPVLSGNLGSQIRMSWTVIGDPVNLAARLEGFNKQVGTNVLLSENIAMAATREAGMECRLLGRVAVIGKGVAVAVFEPIGVYPPPEVPAAADVQVQDTKSAPRIGYTKVAPAPVIEDRDKVSGPAPKAALRLELEVDEQEEAFCGTVVTDDHVAVDFSRDGPTSAPARRRQAQPRMRRIQNTAGGTLQSASAGFSGGRESFMDLASTSDIGSRCEEMMLLTAKKMVLKIPFQTLVAEAARLVPVLPGRAAYAKRFSRAARLFCAGNFYSCLETLIVLERNVLEITGHAVSVEATPKTLPSEPMSFDDTFDSITAEEHGLAANVSGLGAPRQVHKPPLCRCPWIDEMGAMGGPRKTDKAWNSLHDLCQEYIETPPKKFAGSIVATHK